MGYFVRPFIEVDMDLVDQLQNLATYSFLAAAMHIKHGSDCMTNALYADTQATVKNIIFTVARMKEVDPDKALYILLEGTDRLEGLFGDCRTQDHARNFDIEQLGQKLGVATLIHSTMQHNPDLDTGNNNLSLKNITGIDHINPKSWQGEVKVGDVDLKAVWKKGQQKAERLFEDFYGSRMNFDKWFSKTGCDLVRPCGDYVGVNYSPTDAQSEQENDAPLHPEYTNYQNKDSAPEVDTANVEDSDTYDHELGMGLEDLMPNSPEGIDEETEPEAFSKKITWQGKEILKNSYVVTLHNKSSKKVTWRNWRV